MQRTTHGMLVAMSQIGKSQMDRTRVITMVTRVTSPLSTIMRTLRTILGLAWTMSLMI